MSDFIGVVTNAGQAKIAGAIGGAALNLATIRVGDGNGLPIAPVATMTDLVRRVGAAYPIIASARDPSNANFWRVSALIPLNDGPFDIREIGVWDAAGEMIAIARHVLVEKRTPAQGAAVEILTDIVFPVIETAQVTVQVQPGAQVSIFQMLRAGFTVVESATVTAPPGAPAIGRTHVVPAGATGAWNGFAGYLVQWTGSVWVSANAPDGFVVVAQDRAIDQAERWLRKTPAGWVSAMASPDAVGPTRLATPAETAAGAPGLAVSADNLSAMILSKLPIHAEVRTADGRLNVTAASGNVVVTGATLTWRGWRDFDLTGLPLGNRTLATAANKTYHLRWDAPGTGLAAAAPVYPLGRLSLRDLADTGYNPGALAETDPAFDTSFDSVLVATVVTNGANAAAITTLANRTKLAASFSRAPLKPTPSHNMTHTIAWGREPTTSLVAIVPPGGNRDTDPQIYVSAFSRYSVSVFSRGWSDEEVAGTGGPPSWGYTMNATA